VWQLLVSVSECLSRVSWLLALLLNVGLESLPSHLIKRANLPFVAWIASQGMATR
jgi:hypothetical protein